MEKEDEEIKKRLERAEIESLMGESRRLMSELMGPEAQNNMENQVQSLFNKIASGGLDGMMESLPARKGEDEWGECPMCKEFSNLDHKVIKYSLCCGTKMCMKCNINYTVANKGGKESSVREVCGSCKGPQIYDDNDEYQSQLVKFAEEGNSWAEKILGDRYHEGKYIEKDEEKAVYYYSSAADHGDEKEFISITTMLLRKAKTWDRYLFQAIYRSITAIKIMNEMGLSGDFDYTEMEDFLHTCKSLCAGCGAGFQGNLLSCAKCKIMKYCNTNCQKKHWKEGGHKKECKKIDF